MLGTYSDISPAAVVSLGMKDYKFTMERCKFPANNKHDASRPAEYQQLVNPPVGVTLAGRWDAGRTHWDAGFGAEKDERWDKVEMEDEVPGPGAPQGV